MWMRNLVAPQPRIGQCPLAFSPSRCRSMSDPVRIAYMVAAGGHAGAPPDVGHGALTAPIRQIVTWMAERFGLERRLVDWFVGVFFAKVAIYLREAGGPERRAASNHHRIRPHRGDPRPRLTPDQPVTRAPEEPQETTP